MTDTTKRIHIPATDYMDVAYSSYFQDKKALSFRHKLNERSKPLNIDDLSYRVINHWEKNGLIDVDRGDAGTGWRKYSAMDAIWINLMIELRKFGVSIENLRKIKGQLTNRNELYKPSVFPLLEFYTSLFMRDKEETYILIPDNFIIEIATQSQIEFAKAIGGMSNHISISLHDIIKTVYKKQDIELKESKGVELNAEETALIAEIRTGAFKAINVKMKDGKIFRLEKDVILTEKQIHMLLRDKHYDSITIERQKGDVTSIKQTIRDQF